jgi:hypothetical protein
MLSRRLVALPALAVLLGLGLTLGAPAQARAADRFRHLMATLYELKEARKEVKDASHDFGGHRKEALEAIDAAIEQVERCFKFARIDVADVKPPKYDYPNHPHLRHAIVELKEAKEELKDAKEFGEHREKAERDIDFAIKQLEKAAEFAK